MPALPAASPKSPPRLARGALLSLMFMSAQADAASILFVGNSFTFGSNSPVMTYGARTVVDLNGDGMGGVPALFQSFSDQLGLGWRVSLETAAGQTLEWHWNTRRRLLDRKWDAVVLQEYSTLDPQRPGDPARTVIYSGRLADMFRQIGRAHV